jgi:hypothetical protein
MASAEASSIRLLLPTDHRAAIAHYLRLYPLEDRLTRYLWRLCAEVSEADSDDVITLSRLHMMVILAERLAVSYFQHITVLKYLNHFLKNCMQCSHC